MVLATVKAPQLMKMFEDVLDTVYVPVRESEATVFAVVIELEALSTSLPANSRAVNPSTLLPSASVADVMLQKILANAVALTVAAQAAPAMG